MKDTLRMAEPTALSGLNRAEFEAGLHDNHVKHMDNLARQYRRELRFLIRRLRLWRNEKQICDIHDLYLQAEGLFMKEHIEKMLRLYREAHQDLQAMRRIKP